MEGQIAHFSHDASDLRKFQRKLRNSTLDTKSLEHNDPQCFNAEHMVEVMIGSLSEQGIPWFHLRSWGPSTITLDPSSLLAFGIKHSHLRSQDCRKYNVHDTRISKCYHLFGQGIESAVIEPAENA